MKKAFLGICTVLMILILCACNQKELSQDCEQPQIGQETQLAEEIQASKETQATEETQPKKRARADDIPKLYFEGNISEMHEKSDIRQISFQFTQNDQTTTGFCDLKIQGNSSMQYEKKNYTIKFYQDEAHETKLKMDVGWGEQNKYCLKANWVDKTHARNIVTAKLAAQIQQKYDVLSDAPCNGLVDGFPVEIYSNGEFLGLYTFNIPKDAWQFSMDRDNPNHIVFCGEGWALSSQLWEEPNFEIWSLEVGEENAETLDKLTQLFHFINDSTDEVFIADFDKHLDLDAVLNYYVIADFACLGDNLCKNMLLVTYDGEKWYPSLYDMDTSWGTHSDGKSITDYENSYLFLFINRLFYRLETCFADEVVDRYLELRKDILTKEHVMAEFEAFERMIPEETLEKEQTRWGTEIPGYGYDQIETYLDTIIPKLDQKYNDWESWLAKRHELVNAFFANYGSAYPSVQEKLGLGTNRKLQVQVGHPAVENEFHLSPNFG